MKNNNKITLSILFVIAFARGIADYLSYYYPIASNIAIAVSSVLVLVLIFYWYWLDSFHNKYQRSILLNAGVIFVFWLAVPYYLFKSRKAGSRMIPIGIFAIATVGWFSLHYVGFYMLWAIETLLT